MSSDSLPISRTCDLVILNFFQTLVDTFGFQQPSVGILGSDSGFKLDSKEVVLLKEKNRFGIRTASAAKNSNCSITYRRNADQSAVITPDRIEIANSQNAVPPTEIIRITELIADVFLLQSAANPAIQYDPKAFAAVVESHQQIIGRLENTIVTITEDLTQERLKLQKEQDDFIRAKQSEYAERRSALEDSIAQQKAALAEREKQLDDRDNMHARRAIRADLKKLFDRYCEKFALTKSTRQLRWPIHVSVGVALAVLGCGIVYLYTRNIPANADAAVVYGLMAKTALLTIAALGILTWYIRWMNRWFDRHADAEFNLKQFELDVDRASWIVESAMEWRASQNGAIPTHLLESISRNLFARGDRSSDDEMHPADYLASALLGKAARVKLAIGGNEIDLDRKSLREIEKKA